MKSHYKVITLTADQISELQKNSFVTPVLEYIIQNNYKVTGIYVYEVKMIGSCTTENGISLSTFILFYSPKDIQPDKYLSSFHDGYIYPIGDSYSYFKVTSKSYYKIKGKFIYSIYSKDLNEYLHYESTEEKSCKLYHTKDNEYFIVDHPEIKIFNRKCTSLKIVPIKTIPAINNSLLDQEVFKNLHFLNGAEKSKHYKKQLNQ